MRKSLLPGVGAGKARGTIGALATAGVAVSLFGFAAPAIANAAVCPDVQVVSARGTNEPPGPGRLGQALADALVPRIAPKSVDVYPVNYPATLDFPRAADGVVDASNQVRTLAAKCPTTKMVLTGFSQGAAVIGYVTAPAIPDGYAVPPGITGPMPPELANHVAAVAVFGQPSSRFLGFINAPPITTGPLYADKSIAQCVVDDPICSPTGGDPRAHSEYDENGMLAQAADYVAQRLG